MVTPLSISFEGAARTVTGSRHRLRFGERSWLLDCGLFQGHRDEAEQINRTFRFAPAAKNTVMFAGFQAEGTLGRRLRDGAEIASIFGEPVRRQAEVVALDGFSAHADQGELVGWTAGLKPAPRQIFLVHGEFEPAAVLAEKLKERIGAEVHIPVKGEEFELWN